MIVARLAAPTSKLATAKALSPLAATSSLGEILSLGEVDEDALYSALDWLYGRQGGIEKALAKRHLEGGCLVLYDVSSSPREGSYVEGRCCEPAQFGYNHDGKKGKQQIVSSLPWGLLCTAPVGCGVPTAPHGGCPVATLVFEGDTGDPSTLNSQINKLKQRFGLAHVVLVGAHDPSMGHDHPGAPRRGPHTGGAGLDHRAARPCDQEPGRGG